MFKFIQNWKDKRFKKRLERVFNNNVLDCNISISGQCKDGIKPNQPFGGGSIPNDSHKEFEQETTFK